MSDMSPLSGVKRKPDFGAVRAAFDPLRTWAPQRYLTRPALWPFQASRLDNYVGGVDATAGVYRTDHGRLEFSATGACTDQDATAGGWLFGPSPTSDTDRLD